MLYGRLAYNQEWYILNGLCLIPREYTYPLNRDWYEQTCLQIFSGCLPWHDLKSDDIISELRQGRMPSRPGGGGIDNNLWNFIKRCCSSSPRSRPSIADILAFLMQHKPVSKVTPDDLTRMLPNIAPKVIACGGFADIRKCTLTRDGRTIQVCPFSSNERCSNGISR